MMTIGDFARYAQVSVRMLRHYDGLGLLVPARVDPFSGYRFYTGEQLPRLNRLIALKDLGLRLHEIGPLLDARVDPAELRGMLRLRQAELAAQIAADTARLGEIERRLRLIESEQEMPNLDVIDKPIPATTVAEIVTVVTDHADIASWLGRAYERLGEAMQRAGYPVTGPSMSWYQPDGDGLRVAAAFPTAAGPDDGAAVRTELDEPVVVEELEAVPNAMTVVHQGAIESVGQTWQALAATTEQRGRRMTGRCREVYLAVPGLGDTPVGPEGWVVELQQPVELA